MLDDLFHKSFYVPTIPIGPMYKIPIGEDDDRELPVQSTTVHSTGPMSNQTLGAITKLGEAIFVGSRIATSRRRVNEVPKTAMA
jgi:hypothetical protein